MENNENEDTEQECKSDEESDSSSSTYSSSGASSLVSSTPSSSLSISDCSDDPPSRPALANGNPNDTPGTESLTPPMVQNNSDELGNTTNATTSELSPLTSGSQQSTSAHSVQPPVSVLHPKERLSQWLDENPSSPHMPEENMTDPLQRRIIFFDTEPPQLREEKSSVLEDVVHAHFLSLPHV
ncbi:unnamed protein product [Strongylus vulgaris]|uniref:Uncharacterized protein n=1 Tax=Strongylus vulgaris TaxID=40348 RepID=A0A3P7ITA0_STRVU|nr:unnamed protein product [Strongylus vulgaris]